MLGVADSGRVKVFVRVRPPRPHESSRKDLIAVNVQELSQVSKVSKYKQCTGGQGGGGGGGGLGVDWSRADDWSMYWRGERLVSGSFPTL